MTEEITGGCQCGAIRYALTEAPRAEFCHCGMCRKATGGVFAALANTTKENLSWTHGEPTFFASSNAAKRGFCQACGTPLTFAYNDSANIDVTIGSLDDPEIAGPNRMHFAVEHKLSWVAICDDADRKRLDGYIESPVHKPGYRSFQAAADERG